jgi:hypothetical protein
VRGCGGRCGGVRTAGQGRARSEEGRAHSNHARAITEEERAARLPPPLQREDHFMAKCGWCLCMYVDTHLCGKWPASVCHALHLMNAFPPPPVLLSFPSIPSLSPTTYLSGRWQQMLSMKGRKEEATSMARCPRARTQGGAGRPGHQHFSTCGCSVVVVVMMV